MIQPEQFSVRRARSNSTLSIPRYNVWFLLLLCKMVGFNLWAYFKAVLQLYLLNSMNILLLGSYPRFSSSLIKLNLQRAKLTIPFLHHIHPIPSPHTGWTNWPINKFHVGNLNWRKFFPFNMSTHILHSFQRLNG